MIYDELLDIVSKEDVVIGQETRSSIYEQKRTCFRVVNGFLCNSEKKIWIPRRHPQKKLFPLHLDTSVGGHVSAHETYDEAFIRETKEELGLNLTSHDYIKIARLTPHENKTSAFMWVYIIQTNETPPYNINDFISAEWFSIDEIFKKLADGDNAKSDLPLILNIIKDLL